MTRTIFSKYSNERQRRFQIRTDIVQNELGEKTVRKYALKEEGKEHLLHIVDMYQGLSLHFNDPGISFCESLFKENYVESPFIEGVTLQELMENAVKEGREDTVTEYVKKYIAWIKADGGNIPFEMTQEFQQVFGKVELPEGLLCAKDSDIDLIFSNLIVRDGIWNVIDYEWTFSFPIPKNFVLYRALFLAHHQIKRCQALELDHLFELAGLTGEEITAYEQMEKNFQEYVRGGIYPIRDMYQKVNTNVVELRELEEWKRSMGARKNSSKDVKESMIKKIQYHIDRIEYNQGSAVCCGWAFALTKDNEYLPVNIKLTDEHGELIQAPLNRNVRMDVAQALKITNAKEAEWGFNYVWMTTEHTGYKITFSIDGFEMVHEITTADLERSYREYRRRYPSEEAMKAYKDPMRDKDDWYYLKTEGFRALRNIRRQRLNKKDVPYAIWRTYQVPDAGEFQKQKETAFEIQPKISIIVPAYRTPEKFLREMIESVQKQSYENWELCIADGSLNDSISGILEEYASKDARVKYKLLDDNYGISGNTNAALELAAGDYIGLLDHDDILEINALYEVVKVINEKKADVIYTDEDKVSLDLKEYFDPHFKPDYNPDYLKSCNYICHFFVAKTSVVEQAGHFDSSCDGSQDYDFILRCIAKSTQVVHIPQVLYHWRCHPNSTAMNPESKLYCYEAGKRAIGLDLKASGEEHARVEMAKYYGMYEVYYPLDEEPLVSVITTTRAAVEENLKKTKYHNLEVIECGEAYNTENVNAAVRTAAGKYCIFLPNLEGCEKTDWLRLLVSNAERREVGIVGPKLLSTSEHIISAGMALGLHGTAGGLFVGNEKEYVGYFCRAITQQCVSAVAFHGMLIGTKELLDMGGFNEALSVTQAALECCLKVQKEGKTVVFTPYANIYVKSDQYAPETIQVDEPEFQEKYGEMIRHDRYYSCNFDRNGAAFALAFD